MYYKKLNETSKLVWRTGTETSLQRPSRLLPGPDLTDEERSRKTVTEDPLYRHLASSL